MLPQSQHLDLEQDGSWLTVWFNEPERRNPLTNARVDALIELCATLPNAPIQGVTFRGRGGIFCTGGDLKSFKSSFDGSASQDDIVRLSLRAADLFDAVAALPQFTVMAVEGAAMAGGLGLTCIGDMIVASERTRFSLSETRIGLTPAQIAPFVVTRLGMPAARQLMLTGATVDVQEAKRLGLVDQVVAPEEMDNAIEEIQAMIRSTAPQAMAAIKRQLIEMPFQTREQQRQMAAKSFAEQLLSDEAKEGISAFLDKRKPNWAGG